MNFLSNLQVKINYMNYNLINKLILIYIFLIPFQFYITSNQYFKNIQISDIIFLILISLIIFEKQIINSIIKDFTIIDFFIILWFMSVVVSSLFSSLFFISVNDILASIYLMAVYFILKKKIYINNLDSIIETIILSTFICALIGLIGFFMNSIFDIKSSLILFEAEYPYFGETFRIDSVLKTPSMMVNFFILGFLFSFSKIYEKKSNILNYIFLVTISLAILLSFSKSIICIFCGILIVSVCYTSLNNYKKIFIIIFSFIFFFLIYNFFTHFVLIINPSEYHLTNVNFSDKAFFKLVFFDYNLHIFPSVYYDLKLATIEAFKFSYLLGIGPGNFNFFLNDLRIEGYISESVGNWDPHSTPLGIMAENGIFGFIIFCFLIILFFNRILKIFELHLNFKYAPAIVAIFFSIMIDSTSVDIMNFRHVWILFVIITVYFSFIKKKN